MTSDGASHSPVSTARVTGAVTRLADTRIALLGWPVAEIADKLGRVGERFSDPADPLTRKTIEAVEAEAGLSIPMVRRIVSGMARDWTRARLRELLAREFLDPTVLDGFVPDPRGRRRLRALGDPVALHIGSGSVPGVSTTSMIRSLLVKTPVLIKPGGGDRALIEAFRHGLEEEAPELAASTAVLYWRSAEQAVLDAALLGVSRVVVYGSDAAAAKIRGKVPITTPITVYHHRFSIAVLGPDAMEGKEGEAAAAQLAWAVSTFDQRGCVSPHRVYVLGAEREKLHAFGEGLARAMAAEAAKAAPGPIAPGGAARLQQYRAELRMRAAVDPAVAIWSSPEASWTVVVDPDPSSSSLGHTRGVVLVPVADRSEMASRLRTLGPHLQSAGIAGVGGASSLADELSELGVTRIVPLEELPFPPAWWAHDGSGPLRALIRWVEFES